jgi:hypothetical protein
MQGVDNEGVKQHSVILNRLITCFELLAYLAFMDFFFVKLC